MGSPRIKLGLRSLTVKKFGWQVCYHRGPVLALTAQINCAVESDFPEAPYYIYLSTFSSQSRSPLQWLAKHRLLDGQQSYQPPTPSTNKMGGCFTYWTTVDYLTSTLASGLGCLLAWASHCSHSTPCCSQGAAVALWCHPPLCHCSCNTTLSVSVTVTCPTQPSSRSEKPPSHHWAPRGSALKNRYTMLKFVSTASGGLFSLNDAGPYRGVWIAT